MSNNHSHKNRGSITMRRANVHDDGALERLAQLEGRELADEPILLAEVDGCVLAAVSIGSGEAIADPFAPTAHLVELLRRHALPSPAGRRRGYPLGLARRAPWPA